ncbi:hypothetical protein PDN41_32130, partial [Bacillus cereus]|nr:hypothetical protein [Bacillus cereus]
QGLFDMPTFRISIKNNEKLHGKIRLCINIYLKLMDVCQYPIFIKLVKKQPKTVKLIFLGKNVQKSYLRAL